MRGGMHFTKKYLGLSEDKQHMRFSVNFANIERIIMVPLEKGKEMLDARELEEALKEEAARFNQFRRKKP